MPRIKSTPKRLCPDIMEINNNIKRLAHIKKCPICNVVGVSPLISFPDTFVWIRKKNRNRN